MYGMDAKNVARPTQHAPLAILGNYPPRRCGIASFTHDLHAALRVAVPSRECLAVAVTDEHGPYDYRGDVAFEMARDDPAAYAAAADRLNRAGVAALSLQHEFGIFGGPAGEHVLELLRRLRAPVVTTFHTVLTHPDADQRRVMMELASRSHRLVVMAAKGREILQDVYDVPASKIELIPHGIPAAPLPPSAIAKASLGTGDRRVLLTFGLLSPNKGIEVMIEALPDIARVHPDALYLVVGATHPNLKRFEGERYRESLRERAAELGVERNIRFIDAFLELPQLLDYIAAADIYVTPYLNEAQITSGTLAYAVGLGKAVVSTPYWYARELLDGGRGLVVPFASVRAMAEAIGALLDDEELASRLRMRAGLLGRTMAWPVVAERYGELLNGLHGQTQVVDIAPSLRRARADAERTAGEMSGNAGIDTALALYAVG